MTQPAWYTRPLDPRAPAGGEVGVDGRERRGGEFEPFYVPRPVMPQLEASDYPELLAFASERGVTVTFETAHPDTLKPHQRISTLRDAFDPAQLSKPVLASADSYILDGNHRLAAHKALGTPVPCYRVWLEFEPAIAFLFAFPKTTSGAPVG